MGDAMPFGISRKKKEPLHNDAPDGPGQQTVPNPGEMPPDWQEKGMPANSLGTVPATGNRAGGGAFMDNGAIVGYKRNLEFTAGARSQIVGTGTTSTARPHISPTTGAVQISSTEGTEPSAGKLGQRPAVAGSDPGPGNPQVHADRSTDASGDMARGPDAESPGPDNDARHGGAAANAGH